MSRTKNLIQLISSTEKIEFDKVVKAYLKHEYGYNKIVITDGINDTGLDIKVFDLKGLNVQYQLTTQKSATQAEERAFEKKLKEDLVKAKENFNNYKYSNKLIFFYSYVITNKRIRNYVKMAFVNYNIVLELIEANRLAEESENIIEIQKILYKISDLDNFQVKNNVFDNDQENFLFDVLSFGKPSEFKLQIIEAFILTSLYSAKFLSELDIIALCERKFKVKENTIFYSKLLSRLQTNRKIKKSINKTEFILTSSEESIIKSKIDQYELNEKLFIQNIAEILKKYNQVDFLELYIIQLKDLYSNNFSSDLNYLIEEPSNGALFCVINEFITFIKKNYNEDNAKELAIGLLRYCLNSKFIQKIAASKVYCENINNSRLHNYLTTQKKIFIDTSIALYALCYFYNPINTYSNYFYKITKNLIEFSKNENVPLHISERYIWEVQNHIKEAFYLIPFSKIENFTKLGSSRNVFYNYYLFLLKSNSFDQPLEFSEFLEKFGFNDSSSSKSIKSKIIGFLEKMSIINYEFDYEYNIEEANKIFDAKLIANNKAKTQFTRNNDSIMLEFLADNDVEIHPVKPVFLTWDKTFYDVQKEYLKQFPNAQQWLMLPPGKLIDSYAILKFSIDNETVTENLLALISDELVMNTHSLIDTVKFILNPENEISLEYTNKLAAIREKEIHDNNRKITAPPEFFEGEAVIDDVFYNLTNYFQEKEDSNKFELFKQIFTEKEFLNEVISTIERAIEIFYTSHKIEDDLFSSFDSIVDKLENKKSF